MPVYQYITNYLFRRQRFGKAVAAASQGLSKPEKLSVFTRTETQPEARGLRKSTSR